VLQVDVTLNSLIAPKLPRRGDRSLGLETLARSGHALLGQQGACEIPDVIISAARAEYGIMASSVWRIKLILLRRAHPKRIGNCPFRAAVDLTHAR